MSLRLSGLNPLAYMGVEPTQPPQFVVFDNSPTINQTGFNIGTLWLNYATQSVYMLVNLEKGIATWILFSGNLHFLTSNSGGPIGPDANNNINIVGDGTTIVGVGNPATHTITLSTSGTGVVSTLTGNSGGAVAPTAGNINVVGSGPITVTGNPGTSTLTISTSDTGTVSSLTTDDGHVVTPTAGTIIVHGGNNITTTGTVGPNTVTVNVSGTTNHTVQLGNASGSLTSLANGTTGQVLTAQTGGNPIWASASSGGSFTPIAAFGGVSTGITYSYQDGEYAVIGNMVFISIALALSSKGSASGAFQVAGLPFAIGAGPVPAEVMACTIANITLTSGYTYIQAQGSSGNSFLTLTQCGSANSQLPCSDTNIANTTAITITGFYFTS